MGASRNTSDLRADDARVLVKRVNECPPQILINYQKIIQEEIRKMALAGGYHVNLSIIKDERGRQPIINWLRELGYIVVEKQAEEIQISWPEPPKFRDVRE